MEYKTIGIIGGIGPESTIEYYRMIIKRFKEIIQTGDYPSIIINSINMRQMLDYVNNKQYNKLINFLTDQIYKLKFAGADLVVMASNTPHIVFGEVKEKVEIELISIVEETCKAIKEKGLRKVGLLGGRSTMRTNFYSIEALKYDISVLTPNEKQQEYIQDKYMNELLFRNLVPETKSSLIKIINELKNISGIEGIILGGTELPLILSQDDFHDLIVLDTTEIHVNSIVNCIFNN